ncbi:MAG: bifunctional DNA primase/polymerase [Anaerolineae bacterium]|nr:bifunctional DNA primase/polymerase [Anaerolineae bacterium]
MSSLNFPPIVQAAQQDTILSAALAYAALGLSVIPLDGKRPALKSWTQYQQQRADEATIRSWTFGNVGIVCGAVSGNLVVLDLDGAAGYAAFGATFPALAQTYTVASGGGVGRHVYFYVDVLSPSVKAMNTPIGHLEVCGDGRQMVAPPSIHPITGQPYRVEQPLDILRVPNLDDLVEWIEAFKPRQETRTWQPPKISAPSGDAPLNRRVIEEIARVLPGQGFKSHGEWLHGRCLYPERHKHGDRNPSFGYVESGSLSSGQTLCANFGHRALPKSTWDYLAYGAPVGRRNRALFEAACHFRNGGYTMTESESLLVPCYLADSEGHESRQARAGEARRTIQSAYSHSPCRTMSQVNQYRSGR